MALHEKIGCPVFSGALGRYASGKSAVVAEVPCLGFPWACGKNRVLLGGPLNRSSRSHLMFLSELLA